MALLSTNKIETNKVALEISVDAAAFAKAVDNVYKKQVKKISVPGFRQGKAPKKMIEKLYGEGVFFEDAINALYPKALEEAVTEANLELVARPEVEIISVEKADGFTFKATCVTKPEVEVADYKGIKVDKTVKDVTDEEITAEIERMRERNGRTITIEDRAAAIGDSVVIDFEGFVEALAFEGGKAEDHTLVLGSGQFIPGFEDQLVGKNAGDDVDVTVNFPEDYHAETLAGKPALFKVKIKEIKAKELPDVDDEFAKDVSEFDTLEELKASIKEKAVVTHAKAAEDEVEHALIDNIITNMTGEIPVEMIEARIDDMVRDFEQRLQSQGLKLDLYLQYTGMELAAFRKTFADQADKTVRIRLALEKIVEVEGITASEEELATEYEKLATKYGVEVTQVKMYIPAADISKDIAVNKAIDMIRQEAIINEAE